MRYQRLDYQEVVSGRGDEALKPPPVPVSGTVVDAVSELAGPESVSPMFHWLDQPDGTEIEQGKVLDQLLRIHEYERQRLGQELHDSAGQLLVALQLSVAHLRAVEADSSHDNLLDEINDTVRQIDREIRALAFLHYPMELSDRGVCASVQSLVRGFERRTGISTSFTCVSDTNDLNEPTAMALLRISQEALVNVHRHAHASSARVTIRKNSHFVDLVVSDNGVGLPAEVQSHAHGIGLQGMKHRAESLGGTFRAANMKRGTRIHVSLPLRTA